MTEYDRDNRARDETESKLYSYETNLLHFTQRVNPAEDILTEVKSDLLSWAPQPHSTSESSLTCLKNMASFEM